MKPVERTLSQEPRRTPTFMWVACLVVLAVLLLIVLAKLVALTTLLGLEFLIGFALIGFVAGLLAKKFVADQTGAHNTSTLVWLGIVGALVGGALSLVLFRYGRAHVGRAGFDYPGTRDIPTAPADWLSLLVAMVGAVLVIACYKLIKAGRSGL